MAERVDYFFSFRSPYSYLSAPRAFALPDSWDIDLVYRGTIPMVMRGQTVSREKGINTLRDTKREANALGMPFGPVHDPVGPGAMRSLLVGELAADEGLEKEFVLSASRGIWAEAIDVATDDGLKLVVERAWGRLLIKGEMSSSVTLRPSSARIFTAPASVTTRSRPSPGMWS